VQVVEKKQEINNTVRHGLLLLCVSIDLD